MKMMCRFIAMGIHIFVPVSALGCAVILPLAMTGTVVDDPQYANVAALMRYTLSNLEAGSIKLW